MRVRFSSLLAVGLLAASLVPGAARAQQLSLPYAWARSAGGSQDDTGRCLAVDGAGNVYVAGRFIQQASFDGLPLQSTGSSQDVFLAKYDPQGTIVWVRRAGGPGDDSAIGIGVDAAGNAYVTGYFADGTCTFGTTPLTGPGYYDVFLAKYDPQGTLQWARAAGGSGDDEGWGVSVDPAGNAAITGFFDNTLTVDSGLVVHQSGRHAFVVRYDTQGQPLWAHGLADPAMVYGRGVSTTAAGDVFVTGQHTDNGTDGFLVKYDALGTEQWSRRFGGPASDFGISVATDTYGGVFVAGQFSGQASFSPAATLTSAGGLDAFLAKFNGSTGSLQWVSGGGGPSTDYGTNVSVDQYGNPMMTGFFGGTAVFGPTTLSGGWSANAFRLWYDYQGQALGGHAPATSGGYSVGYGVTQDPQGNAYETGAFSGATSFDAHALSSAGQLDAYVAKVNTALARLHPARPLGLAAAAAAAARMSFYPNPASATQAVRLTLELPGSPAVAARLDVFDALGRRALSRPVTLDAQGAGEAGLLPLRSLVGAAA